MQRWWERARRKLFATFDIFVWIVCERECVSKFSPAAQRIEVRKLSLEKKEDGEPLREIINNLFASEVER